MVLQGEKKASNAMLFYHEFNKQAFWVRTDKDTSNNRMSRGMPKLKAEESQIVVFAKP